MKKAMKLVWMMLFALPLISLTACGDDEPEDTVLFEDYSALIGKTRQGTIDYMKMDPTSSNEVSQNFFLNNGEVINVGVYYYDEDGKVLDKAAQVVTLLDPRLKSDDVINYLGKLFDYKYIDEDGDYYYTHKKLDIYYDDDDHSVLYIDVDNFYPDTKAGEEIDHLAIKRAFKALINR